MTDTAPSPRRGQCWWVRLPGQPDDPHQPRPALVISADARNRAVDDVIVVPAFSRGALGPTRVAVPSGVGGLPHASVIFCDEVTTLDVDFLGSGPLGAAVPDTVLDAVVRGIRRAIGEVVLEPPQSLGSD